MIDLAVATREETFERLVDPLAERGIRVGHLRTRERTIPLAEPPDDLSGFDVGYVFPPRLMEGGVVDALLDLPWVNDRGAVLTSRNKGGVLAALSTAGLPTPETVVVSNPVAEPDIEDAFRRLEPPVVVKPNSSTRGIGVAKVHDADTLSGVVDYLRAIHDFEPTGDRSFLLQEFVSDARDVRAMVLDGEYAGAAERRLPDEAIRSGRWKHNVHRDAVATGVALPDEQRDLVERVAEVLDIDLLGVDLLATDDRVLVSETNARPTIDDEGKYEPGFFDRLADLIHDRAP